MGRVVNTLEGRDRPRRDSRQSRPGAILGVISTLSRTGLGAIQGRATLLVAGPSSVYPRGDYRPGASQGRATLLVAGPSSVYPRVHKAFRVFAV